jgi:hypothetical protein
MRQFNTEALRHFISTQLRNDFFIPAELNASGKAIVSLPLMGLLDESMAATMAVTEAVQAARAQSMLPCEVLEIRIVTRQQPDTGPMLQVLFGLSDLVSEKPPIPMFEYKIGDLLPADLSA